MLPAVTCIIRVRLPPSARATRLPYTTLFRSSRVGEVADDAQRLTGVVGDEVAPFPPGHVEERLDLCPVVVGNRPGEDGGRSEEHTSELQSRGHLVCRLLLEKKNNRGREP